MGLFQYFKNLFSKEKQIPAEKEPGVVSDPVKILQSDYNEAMQPYRNLLNVLPEHDPQRLDIYREMMRINSDHTRIMGKHIQKMFKDGSVKNVELSIEKELPVVDYNPILQDPIEVELRLLTFVTTKELVSHFVVYFDEDVSNFCTYLSKLTPKVDITCYEDYIEKFTNITECNLCDIEEGYLNILTDTIARSTTLTKNLVDQAYTEMVRKYD